jgi:hypothetical protein
MLALLRELLYGWIYRRTLRVPALTKAQAWAIAAGANLAKLNGSSLDSLSTKKLPVPTATSSSGGGASLTSPASGK